MAKPVWTLKTSALNQTLKDLGIVQTLKTRNSLRPSELAISFLRRAIVGGSPIANGEKATLYRDGVPVFVGECYQPQRLAGVPSQRMSIVLKCPWQALEEITYLQRAGSITSPQANIPNTGAQETLTAAQLAENAAARQVLTNYPYVGGLSPIVFGGTSDTDGTPIAVGPVITQVLNFALANGAAGLFQIGTVPAGILVPREKMTNVSCAEAIRRNLRLLVDWIQWTDFSTSPPTFNFLERSTMAARSLAWGVDVAPSVRITPRFDIQKDGIELYLKRGYTCGSLNFQNIKKQIAGAVTNRRKILLATLDLDPISIDPNTGETSAYDPDPTGVAARLFTALNTLFYSGQIVRRYSDLPLDDWTTKVVNITGAATELATMRAMVQSSVESIESGTVTLNLDAPPRLTPADVQALQKIGRARIPATQDGVSTNSGGGGATPTTQIQAPTTPTSTGGTPSGTTTLDFVDISFFPSVSGTARGLTDTGFAFITTYPSFRPIPSPLAPALDIGYIRSRLNQISNVSLGQYCLADLSSGNIDLRSYLPTTYQKAEVVVAISDNYGALAPKTLYIPITNGLGKLSRFSIPLATLVGIYPGPDVYPLAVISSVRLQVFR